MIKYKPVQLFFVFILTFCWSKYTWAQLPVEQYVWKETTQASFRVRQQNLFILSGSKNVCQAANEFIVHALKDQNATLSGLEYLVFVKEILLGEQDQSNNQPTSLDEYQIEFTANKAKNRSFNRFFSALKKKSPIHMLVSQYEAPIYCDYLAAGEKLILIAYCGRFPAREGLTRETFLAFIKEREAGAETGHCP